MINSAMSCSDYAYYNHYNKRICFHFKFEKRVKTKVIKFLKENHEESKIIKFLETLNLKLVVIGDSNRYRQYEITEED